MTSYFRVVLAILVAISHVNVRLSGYNEGVWAVTVFYILAGHVIQRIFFSLQNIPIKERIIIYAVDRLLRIFPLYLTVIVITAFFLALTGYGDPHFPLINVILNILIIPLNYYMYDRPYIEIVRQSHWWFNPPSWSLGAELQAYAVLPVLILAPASVRLITLIISLVVYSVANLGIIHSDYFGYRLLPGILSFFLSGVIIERIQKGIANRSEIGILLGSYVFFMVWLILAIFKGIKGAYTIETSLGFLLGVPLVYFLLEIKKLIKIPYTFFASSLSYSIFLVHFPLIWLFDFITGTTPSPLIVVLCSLTISVVLALVVEIPMFRIRKKLLNGNRQQIRLTISTKVGEHK